MTKLIAIVSGKGGVGKTTSTINIGQSLTKLGKRVLLLDANLATPNLALQLGMLSPEGTLNKFLRKEKHINEIIYLHNSGISLIPASPSFAEFQKTNPQNLNKIFTHLHDLADFVLIDAPSGIGFEVNQIIKHCDEILVIVTPNLSSGMDALKSIELARSHDKFVVGAILNMTHSGRHEMKQREVQKTLSCPILANIKYDRKMRKALHKEQPLTHLFPRSNSAKQFKKVAEFLTLQ